MDDITLEAERQRQCSKRKCLLIHGIPEIKNEDRNVLALVFIDTKMEIKITQNDIDKRIELGNQKSTVSRDQ